MKINLKCAKHLLDRDIWHIIVQLGQSDRIHTIIVINSLFIIIVRYAIASSPISDSGTAKYYSRLVFVQGISFYLFDFVENHEAY